MASGSWAAARLWAAADRRARWRSLVALGLIAGVTTGLSLAALAGSQRSGTALERLRDRTNASDAIVFPSQVNEYHPDWTAFSRRPEVRSLATWAIVNGDLGGEPDGLFFTPLDDQWISSVDAPVIVEGRRFDTAADDELLVADAFAAREGIHVGDVVPFTPYTVDDINEGSDSPNGPLLQMRVVGIVRTPIEALFVTDGFAVASPGLLDHHPEVGYFENGVVQLVNPATDVPALEEHAHEDLAPGTPVLNLHGLARRVTTTTDVERGALALLAAAIAIAGIVLAGQVVVRSASQIGPDARVLQAMGMSKRAIAGAATLSHVPAVVVAAVSAVLVAVVASRWLPLGLASRLEPSPGMRLDTLIVLLGTALLVVALTATTFAAAWLAVGQTAATKAESPRGLVDWIRRRASAAVGIGTTMAFHKGTGRGVVAVRPALLGAVVGVLGVATAVTLDAGLRDTLDHPERAGVAWDGQVTPLDPSVYTEHGFDAEFVSDVGDVPQIRDAAQLDRLVLPVEDTTGIGVYAVRPLTDATAISLVVLEGDAPRHPGEVAVGPSTAQALGVGIGDTIEVGPARALTMKVVGTALFPAEVHSEFDEGVWITPEDFDAVDVAGDDVERFAVVRFAPGATADGLAALQAVGGEHGAYAAPAELPPELTNLREVLPLPKFLAAFLAVLALAALLHVLVSTTRVRAHEFAVLRAIGFTRRGTRLVLNVQATAVFLTGLVFGIPLGVALGRVIWALIAESVPLEQVAPLAAVATALLIPVALVLAQVLAFGPGRRLARLRTAEVLRAE